MKNGDLVVEHARVPGVVLSQTGRADTLNIDLFTKVMDMIDWEYAAYRAYGDDRCIEENIDTLGDLFGGDFNAQFVRQYDSLLKQNKVK